MNKKIDSFLKKEKIAVLSVIISANTPHAASVHFSYQENPFKIFIQTSEDTVKAKPFLKGKAGKAALVIGFSEEEWITLQMRGTVKRVAAPKKLLEIYKIHYAKHPNAEQHNGPHTVFLEFIPTWWRYTDFNTEPETIITN